MSQRAQRKSGIITTDNIQRSTSTPGPTPSSPTRERRQGTFLLIAAALENKQTTRRNPSFHNHGPFFLLAHPIVPGLFLFLPLPFSPDSHRHPECHSSVLLTHHLQTSARGHESSTCPGQSNNINAAFQSHEQQKYKF